MRRTVHFFPLMLMPILLLLGIGQGFGQGTDQTCAPYFAAVVGSQSARPLDTVSPISDQLLGAWQNATPCLVKYLATLQNAVVSPAFAKTKFLGNFLRATGAIRTIMANSQNVDNVIKLFRGSTDLAVTSVLAYGARSDDISARENSLRILANVIDNTTVCVPLDHLYDPSITTPGRANLLTVVQVVAPWAYHENYNNLLKLVDYMSSTLPKNDPNLTQTYVLLQSISRRLASQSDNSNKGVYIPADLQICKRYKPIWAKAQYLKY